MENAWNHIEISFSFRAIKDDTRGNYRVWKIDLIFHEHLC